MKRIILIISVVALLLAACGAGESGSAGPVTTTEPADSATTTTVPTETTQPGDDTGTTTTTQAPTDGEPSDQVFVELYFVKEGLSADAVTRAVDSPMVATNAIKALIEGPTPDEMDTELSSAIPRTRCCSV